MRSKNRLAELLQRAESAGAVYQDTVLAADGGGAGALPPDMEDMLQEAEAAGRWAGELAALTAALRRLAAQPAFHASAEMQEQLDSMVTQAHALALKAAGALRQLEQRAGGGTAGGGAGGGAAARAARLQAACCRRRFAAALEQHHAALDELRVTRRKLLADQLALTNSEITEEECERLLDDNRLQVFVDNIAAETLEARRGLREAEARRAELARVEAALAAVRDLFAQLAGLVAKQQEQIDSVEYFALQATGHVESGGAELLRGNVFRKKTKQKKIYLIVFVSVAAFIILLLLIYT